MTLPCQENSSPPYIRQQAAHLLHEYKLDDKTLQKAQLKQHKIFQNYPTSPAPAAPSAPPPLAVDAKPKVLSTQGQKDPDNDYSEALFDTKSDSTFPNDNDKPLTHTHMYEITPCTHSPSRQRLSGLLDWDMKNESFLAFTTSHLALAKQNLARYKLQIVEPPDPNKDGPDFEPNIWIWVNPNLVFPPEKLKVN